MPTPIAAQLHAATARLRRDVAKLRFGAPVTHVYNPLDYARAPHRRYIDTYGATKKSVIFLGMNPGPFGMIQTGVPFGSIPHVRDWLKIDGRVKKPTEEHPKRPVLGFACPRTEVSGERLWGGIAKAFGAPERFFARAYVANYCPLAFLETTGRNRTPDKLPAAEREPLFEACDRHLRRVVRVLEPSWVVGIGVFAENRALEVLQGPIRIGRVLHPSPANPRAGRDWSGEVRRQLQEQGICASLRPPKGRTRRGPRSGA